MRVGTVGALLCFGTSVGAIRVPVARVPHGAPAVCGARARTPPPRACADERLDIFGRRQSPTATGEVASASSTQSSRSEPVVKVYAVHSPVSPQMPWTSKTQEESTGSGFQIDDGNGLCILTNAHVVADAAYVEVRKAGDSRKYVATRRKLSHECDLATLTVEDAAFWEGAHPLSFGAVPALQDEVSVVGYPEGGEGVSVTVGVVSRIEIQRYAHSGANLLAIQIDAAINPGNSGGPALDDEGSVIGVAFQNQQDSQNIGYVIPVPTIRHFLDDTDPERQGSADGAIARTRGFCSLGIFWQSLENGQLRAYCGMDEAKHSGVLVRGVAPLAAAAGTLRRDDVLLALAGQRIANDGSFAVGAEGAVTQRLSFQHLIHLRFPGEHVKVRVLRAGVETELTVPVQPLRRLVPATVFDEPQPYFLYGGLAFVGLTEPYLHEWGDDWLADAPQDLVHLALTGVQLRPDEQPVILSRVFPSRGTAGIAHMADRRVVSVNGQPVLNLKQMYGLVHALQAGGAPYLNFELLCTGGNAVVAMSTELAAQTLAETLVTYRVPAAASAELVPGAEGAAAPDGGAAAASAGGEGAGGGAFA